jgi:aminoglycoside phosphotransferase family enzyme/predicted kinase
MTQGSAHLPDHLKPMLDAACYPHPVDAIELIQTHISWIFLTGNFAYKVKKPVDFGFLNFTSLNQRKDACMEELRLNRRLAAAIYLDLLPVYDNNKQPFKAGIDHDSASKVIDYAVKMVQFNQSDLFDVRLTHHNFDPAWMDSLAVQIADFHRRTDTPPYVQSFGAPETLLAHIEANLTACKEHLPDHPAIKTVAELLDKSISRFNQDITLLKMRQKSGYIRDCHGDLHLKNITLFQGQPTAFDCIEFNEAFRMIDTMNDIAFLLMDCDSRERGDLGYRFLSRYLEQSGDYDGLQLLPLYLSYRAGVRGKVSSLLEHELIQEADSDQTERRQAHDDVSRYFILADSYLSTTTTPELFAIGGLSGSGKSHLALLALNHVNAVIIRSDATRKRIAKEHSSPPLYSKKMNELTYQSMLRAAKSTIKAGYSVILDATFLHTENRTAVETLAAKMNVTLHFYWLDVDAQQLRERVRHRSQHESDISDADLQILDEQLKHYVRPADSYIRFLDNSDYWPPV